ncbi:GntR family transcriptional regulator [Mesorhizobium sp. M0174]|uniref:GntR family transcriptional regulator n=1 Tax=Mesorhizobium sp. M0174 TaxID=2956904 RepID=UPI00333BB8E9
MQLVELGSLSSRTYLALREALIAGNFRPGQRLLMQDLAQQFGTSITPVREACLRLVSEQAFEVRSGRFVAVPELTRSRYWQVRLMRIALEGLAAELAAEHVTDADIAGLEKVHRKFVLSETSGDVEQTRVINREFHFGVYRLCQLDMIIAQIESLWVSMGPMLNVYYEQSHDEYVGGEEHDCLLDAFRSRNKRAARKAIERDIVRGGATFLRYFNERDHAIAADG